MLRYFSSIACLRINSFQKALKILDPCTLKTLNPPTGMVNQDYMGLLFGHASSRDNARAKWDFKQQQKRNDRFSFQFYRLHAKISMRKIDGHFLRYFFWCNFSESVHKETIIIDVYTQYFSFCTVMSFCRNALFKSLKFFFTNF